MGATTNQPKISEGQAGRSLIPDEISIAGTDTSTTENIETVENLDRAGTPILRRGRDFANNVSLLVLLFFAYSSVRSVTADEFTTAMLNATEVLRVQESLGLPSELSFQQAMIAQTGFLKAANIYYIAVHFPLTIAFLVWVWMNHRIQFNRVRNTLIAVTATGLIMHITYPLAPPRMIEGFVDTADWLGPDPYDTAISAAANQIAAMPSLHVGWAFLVALSMIWILKTRWRWLALVHPVLTSAVVVVTANHYWSDAIVAVVLVVVGWFLFSPSVKERLVRATT